MTEKHSLKDLLKCKICNQTYNKPIILPCSRSICSSHVNNETSNKIFKCDLCNNCHLIPSNGFLYNYDLNQLICVGDQYVTIESRLSDKNKQAIKLCVEWEEVLTKCEFLSKDPSLYVYAFFRKL